MLADRPYMRDDYPRERTSVLTWLISSIVAGFVLQLVAGSAWLTGGRPVANEFILTISGLQQGRIWTLLTHSFVHDPHYLFHIVVNLLGLFWLGRALLPVLGPRRFIGVYTAGILLGALWWTGVHWRMGGAYYGATAGVDALLVVFACFYPNQKLDFLLFFVFPVTLRPKYIALALATVDILGLFFYEIRGWAMPIDFAIGHSAHLGGMAAGWLYFRYVHVFRWKSRMRKRSATVPRWVQDTPERPAAMALPAPAGNKLDLRAEVDRILDKINSHGLGTLTVEEKRVLDSARDTLSRH